MAINGELGVEQHARVLATQLYHVFQHCQEVPLVIKLVLSVAFVDFRAIGILLSLRTGVWDWSLSLVENVQTPNSFQKTKENPLLELVLQLSQRENLPRIVERVGT